MLDLKKQIKKQLYLLGSIFSISLILILLINFVSNYISANLNQDINYQKNKIITGELIVNKIEVIRNNFITIKDLSSNEDRLKIVDKIYKNSHLIEEYLTKLKNGGNITIFDTLNVARENEQQRTITLQPIKKGKLPLESIEITPKLNQLKEKLTIFLTLPKDTKQKDIEQFYKTIQPIFKRLIENSNRLLYESNIALQKTQEETDSKLSKYQIITYSLTILVFFIAFFLFRKIFNHIEEISKNLQEKTTELDHTSKQLATMMDTVKTIILVTNGKVLEKGNRAFKDFFDLSEKEYIAFKESGNCICEHFLETEKKEFLKDYIDGTNWIDYIFEHPDKIHKALIKSPTTGLMHYFKVDASRIDIEKEKKSIVVFTDITEIETYQASLEAIVKEAVDKNRDNDRILAEQAKMAAIGEMMRNIAHHWRQPLNVLSLNIQDMLDANEFGELNTKYVTRTVNSSMEQIKYLSGTIENFKNFFSSDEEVEEFQVAKVLKQIKDLVQVEMSAMNIELITECKESTLCKGQSSELKQVLLNIVNNAKDAIGRNEEMEEFGKISIKATENGQLLTIEVSDNAGGIDKEIINRIFEPYFTTKFKSQGTGLGLYMAKTVVEKSLKGHLSVSNRDKGATFTIDLIAQKSF